MPVSLIQIDQFLLVTVFVHLIYYDFEMINQKPDLLMNNFKPAQSAISGAVTMNQPQMQNPGSKPKPAAPQPAQDNTRLFGTPTSINAIFFGSILLSSRLNRTSKVFTLLYISLCIFGFIPIFRHLMKHKLTFWYYSGALVMSLSLIYSIFKVNPLFGFLYFSLIVFISFLSPLIFIYAYQFKNDIRGPWDCP